MSDPRQCAFSMFDAMHRYIREMVLGGLYTKHTRKDTHLGAMPAKFLSSRVMVMIVLMAFLAAGEASHVNFMPTFFSSRDLTLRIFDTGQQNRPETLFDKNI